MSGRRLIEAAFPLKQASLDSVHEKNVRHGHISTLHIWPARRPLAASRAALIATLLPDPGTPEERKKLIERIGGRVIQKVEKKKTPSKTVDVLREETIGGVLHWGRESSPDLEWFRQEIRKAYGGRAPRVLDPFAGGGAIPLEAMRLGCEVTAADINPVAWFILRCTLEYPQKLAGQHRPLPQFAVESQEFMEGFLKGTGKLTPKQIKRQLDAVQQALFPPPDVDLTWHVRAWGYWVLQQARKTLERLFPVVDDTPTVAYLWARTVSCKNCRATVPLLKTTWLSKKSDKRVLLRLGPSADRSAVVFSIEENVPVVGGNPAQRREHDKRIGAGTMTKAGAWCPCCGQPGTVAMGMEDIRQEGLAGRIGTVITAVIVDGGLGKRYRTATTQEVTLAAEAGAEVGAAFASIPFGVPDEEIPHGGSRTGGGSPFTTHLYGVSTWAQLFTGRQLLGMGTFVRCTREARAAMASCGYPAVWIDAVQAYLSCAIARLADYNSMVCLWGVSRETIAHTFTRFAIPITWDFCETNPILHGTGSYDGGVDWVARYVGHALAAGRGAEAPAVVRQDVSRLTRADGPGWDAVVTDPPYYDVIPYSDLADFFLVWLRRTLHGAAAFDEALESVRGPKWNHQAEEGELIDDSSRFDGDKTRSRKAYEEGMRRAFGRCLASLNTEGKLLVVFANKQPAAWEALVGALVGAGATVKASWPIVTEMRGGVRNFGRASLASSVWLVCGKRAESAPPGWDNRVLEEMRTSIHSCLREYWDAGIRGPDFVWAATGPALEAYSRYPVVKKANEPGMIMEVSEFLRAVRRIVVDFVVGRVLNPGSEAEAVSGLDDLTTYYLLHRNDLGLGDTPVGPCILYAVSCGLSDAALADEHDLLARTGGSAGQSDEDEDDYVEAEEAEAEIEEGTGSKVRLKAWQQRKRKGMGYDGAGCPSPLIDQIHRVMHLWKAGDQVKVDEYLEARALASSALFHRVLQALIELAEEGSDERAILESLSNHVAGRRPEAAAQVDGWDIRQGGGES